MKTSLTPDLTKTILDKLSAANAEFSKAHPGESAARQPVQTVYGGAHLFRADTAQKLGQIAVRTFEEYAPNCVVFAKAIGLPGNDLLPSSLAEIEAMESALAADAPAVRKAHPAAWFAWTIYHRVLEKLKREPVEDFRVDFEDGYGNRPDVEEDSTAVQVAHELVKGMDSGTLPPFNGIRVKPLNEELRARAIKTLDIVLSTMGHASGGRLPANFVVTIPKVVIPEQAAAAAQMLAIVEQKAGFPKGSVKMEVMIETPQSILNKRGESNLPLIAAACGDRLVAAHFGVYDYTASTSITAQYQAMDHPACDFARHMMQVAFAGTGIWLSDGATNVMPIAPHRAAKDGPPLKPEQVRENFAVVHRAWKLHYDHVRHSLRHAYYQGWDLNPAQFATRYAAVFCFFLESLDAAGTRLKNFIEKAGQATLVGDVFDDAATGQGLLNFFLRGVNCGAITEEEALQTGLTLDEFRMRSFVKIVEARRP